MESYGNDRFLSQEGYASIDFTLLDRPSTSVASAPEFTAPLLPDSSFPSLDFLDGSGIDSLGGVLRNAEEAHFHSHGRHKDIDWRKEKALHASSANMYIQGGENPEPELSSSQHHIPAPHGNLFSAKQSGSDNLQGQLSTSGNRVGDEVHDFFEQEHLSQQQSQLDKANWSVMNNNAWPGDSQNKMSRHIPQSSYNTEPNTQPDEGRHSSRMALGVRSPQEGPNNNVMKSVSRNQPLIFDSLVNGSSAGHIRSNQGNSAGDGGTPEQNQSSTGSLAGPDIQQGHIVGRGSNHSRNSSEGVENVEARVNYDFLGSQLLLKGQLQAGPQFHGTTLQPGLEEQLWKQFSYQKHLQELQRQQLEQHARQQQAQQLEQQARQAQSQQLGQQARQAQAQLLEQQVRQQQVQQFMQQARLQQFQQLEQQGRLQQFQQLEHQARQQQAQQLEHEARQQQARQQQAQRLEQHARQQLEHEARQQQAQQQQAQQLEQQHARQQLEHEARQQQAQQQQAQRLEQHARQQLEHEARQQQVQQQQAQQLEQQHARQQLEHEARQQQAQQQQAQQLEQQHARQQLEHEARQQQAQQQQAQRLEQHALQQLEHEARQQQAQQQQAQQLEHEARQQQAQQQQVQQLEQHARQQQAQQQTRQPQSQQLGQQARQAQAQLLEQQVRRQQVQQFMHQARQQQAQQLEHQGRQQQAQQLQQQARQQQAQQLEYARQQQTQQQAQQLSMLDSSKPNSKPSS